MALTVFRGADRIVTDPGTFAYHEDPEARDRCRGTPAHSTVSFGGRSQSEMLGPFLWGRRARVSRSGDGFECVWATGEIHARRIEVAGDRILLHDRVRGEGAALAFPLAPGARTELGGTRATLSIGASRVTFEGVGIDPWQIVPGEFAPRFSAREPATTLVAAIPGSECRTEIRLR